MTWGQRFGRWLRPFVLWIARVMRGESDEDISPPSKRGAESEVGPPPRADSHAGDAAASVGRAALASESALPAWGMLPEQAPLRVELLRGRSSIELRRRSRKTALQVLAGGAAATLLAIFNGVDPGVAPLFGFGVLLVGAVVFAVVGEPSVKRKKEEHRAGYTIWRQGPGWMPQVDAETGFEIRPANHAELSEQEEAAALKRVREIARYLRRRRT